MKQTAYLLILLIFSSCSLKPDHKVFSPDGNIEATVSIDLQEGVISYEVEAAGKKIINNSRAGILTDKEDFSRGLKLRSVKTTVIDESYHLPQGKTSSYKNHANESLFLLKKGNLTLNFIFRVYNDGFAFSYQIPGEGEIELIEEVSSVNFADSELRCYGQKHPNRYGYEGSLGEVVNTSLLSTPVLVYAEKLDVYALIGQAATYGHYIQPHFHRDGSSFSFKFPLDQEKLGSVHSKLPFQSPWRMVIISSDTPKDIVESTMVENLNPPTDPALLNADGSFKDWIKPGRVMWDFIARDGDKPRMWIDAVSEMGWEYYLADAGFVNRWGGEDSVTAIVDYAQKKGVGVIGWAHTREFDTPEKAKKTMKQYAGWGLKGAKIDFFDHNTLSENPRDWRDHEDTQQSLQMRDWIFKLAIENDFLIELHGNTMPTGERRQFPNLMTLEGVDGMERRTKPAANDLTIPFVRNIMGPVSYTVIHFERSPGTDAYQLAMPVVYEAGLMIYAEHGKKLLEWQGREYIASLPSTWDETLFIDGSPTSYIVMARRKDNIWYLGGMTDQPRDIEISLDFLEKGRDYQTLLFTDLTHDTMDRDILLINRDKKLKLKLLERGGFAARLTPDSK